MIRFGSRHFCKLESSIAPGELFLIIICIACRRYLQYTIAQHSFTSLKYYLTDMCTLDITVLTVDANCVKVPPSNGI